MEPRTLKFVAQATEGELLRGSPEVIVSRVCTDSRLLGAGDLFVAVAGDRFDGHAFVAEALRKGAAAAMVNRAKMPVGSKSSALIGVEDTRKALAALAVRYRRDFHCPFIAIGGSNGKTTTKELVASVLRERLKVLSSEASFNNALGVPLTLLNLRATHQLAVLEVGTNHPGELAPLVAMIQPLYGVLTNIGREHLEFFGDMDGVAQEEGWLAELLPADGALFVDGDGPDMRKAVARTRANVVQVGFEPTNDWRVREVTPGDGGVTFQVEAPDREFGGEYEVRMVGRHQVRNALLAIAIGRAFGLSRSEIKAGLLRCVPPRMRMQLWKINGLHVLDDTYNANADSMRAALQALLDFPCQGRRVAVLGDMAELGRHSSAAHAEVGRFAAELGVGQLFAVGSMAPVMGQAAREAGLTTVREFSAVEAATEALQEFVKAGDVVLLKASRSSRLERISESLRARAGDRSG